eukprot:1555395-Rhodomonas_salina.1
MCYCSTASPPSLSSPLPPSPFPPSPPLPLFARAPLLTALSLSLPPSPSLPSLLHGTPHPGPRSAQLDSTYSAAKFGPSLPPGTNIPSLSTSQAHTGHRLAAVATYQYRLVPEMAWQERRGIAEMGVGG